MINKKFIVVALAILIAVSIALLYKKSPEKLAVAPAQKERTLAIIKPDAVAAGNAQNIITAIKNNGFTILAQKETTLDQTSAEQFYAVHKEKPFFADLITYITSGPIVLLALEREDAVPAWRALMGATNPANAAEGTIRKLYGTDIQRNAVHGSDSAENAENEIKLFFPEL